MSSFARCWTIKLHTNNTRLQKNTRTQKNKQSERYIKKMDLQQQTCQYICAKITW